jgi:hypothetical protein
VKRDQVLLRLCRLCTLVGDKAFRDSEAHDCFCEQSVPLSVGESLMALALRFDMTFQFSERVLEYIEDAVKAKMESSSDA